MHRATVRDVARNAGVSVATVSRVLSGADRVSASARARVEQAIAELHYSPSSAAQALRMSRTRSLGLVLPGLENPFFPSLIQQAVEVAEVAGYSITIRLTRTPLATAIEMSQGQQVDGIVVVGNQAEPEAVEGLGRSLVPLVAFDRLPGDVDLPLFQVDNCAGATQVVCHLIERLPTNLRLLHITGPSRMGVSRDRHDGVLAAVKEARKLGRTVELIVREGDFSEESGYHAMESVIAQYRTPSGVFASNDLMAIGAIRAAQVAGHIIGKDMLVAGFDGLALGTYVNPTLTSYCQPIAHISHETVTRLIGLIEAPSEFEVLPKLVRFDGEFIVRDSTGGTRG